MSTLTLVEYSKHQSEALRYHKTRGIDSKQSLAIFNNVNQNLKETFDNDNFLWTLQWSLDKEEMDDDLRP